MMEASQATKRVRTGCITCKNRKVKCDEEKPYCLRCRDSGRTCAGYPAIPPRAKRKDSGVSRRNGASRTTPDKEELSRAQMVTMRIAESKTTTVPERPQRPQDGTSDVLDMFKRQVVPAFKITTDREFWGEIALHLAGEEPPVHHALAAMCDLYLYAERRRRDDGQSGERQELLKQSYSQGLQRYNQSIQELAKRSNLGNPESGGVYLVCSVIFSHIEVLCSRYDACMIHLERGMQLLQMNASRNGVGSAFLLRDKSIHDVLVPILQRLRHQAMAQGYMMKRIPFFQQRARDLDKQKSSQEAYANVDEAVGDLTVIADDNLQAFLEVSGQKCISPAETTSLNAGGQVESSSGNNNLNNDCSGSGSGGSGGSCVEVATLSARLDRWDAKFTPLEAELLVQSNDLETRLNCETLRMYHTVAEIRAWRIGQMGETAYDQLLPKFVFIVRVVTNLLFLRRVAFESELNGPSLTFELGVLYPLWFTATKCRQRLTRRTALALIEEWPDRQGLWDPRVTARAARCVVQEEDAESLDESASNEVWPAEWKRVHASRFRPSVEAPSGTYEVFVEMVKRSPNTVSAWETIRRKC